MNSNLFKNLSQDLIQSSLDGILAFDTECRYTIWNPAMERISGYEKSKVLGKCAFDVFPFLKEMGEDHYFLEALQGKNIIAKERPYMIPETGRQGFFDGHYSPVREESGEIAGGMAIIRDITERKRTEEGLRETNQALQALIEASPLATISLDLDGKVKTWNPAAEQIFGWKADEVIGRFNPIVPKQNEDDFRAKMAALLQGKILSGVEVTRQKKDGSLIDLSLSTAPLRDVKGNIRGVMGILADMTGYKRAQEALRQSEARFRRVVDSNMIGLVFSDVTGRIVDANDAFLQMVGYTRDELHSGNVNWKALTPPEYADLDIKALSEMAATGICVPFEKEFTLKDGTRIPVLIGAAFLEGSQKDTVGFVLDLTERKRANRELRKSEIRFRRLFESDLFGIILGETHGKIRDANHAFLQMVGHTEEDLHAGRLNWKEMTPKEYRHLDEQAVVDIVEKGTFVPFEKEYLRKDGSRIPILIGGAALEEPSNLQGICFVLDITERKRADERLRQSEEKYRLLFESNPYPMWVFDLETLAFLAVNQAAIRRYGYSREEFLSMTIKELMPVEDIPLLMKDLPQIQTRVGSAGIWRNQKKDGTIIDVEITSDIISFAGKRAKIVVADDITERLRAEEAVKRSEAHLRAIIDSEPECVKTVAIDGTLLAINPAGIAMIQAKSEEEAVGRNVFQLVHPEDRPIYQSLHRFVGQGASGSLQFRVIGLEGRLRWVEMYSVPLKDQQGRIGSVLCVTRDITERKQAEEELHESQRTYATLISNLPGLAYRCRNDKEWTVDFVSEGALPLTGYSPSDFVEGRVTVGQLIHPDDREPVWSTVQIAVQEKKPYQLTYRIKTASGDEKWVWEKGRGVYSTGGELLFLEGLVIDTTERKRAEEVLRQTNERFHLVTRATNDAVWDWDLITNAVWWSDNFQTLFHYEPEEMEQKLEWWTDRLHPDDKEQVLSGVNAAIARGDQLFSIDYRFLRGDGTYAAVFDRGYIVKDPAGKPVRMIGAVMDISERKRAEEALEKSREQLRDLSTHLQARLEEERTRIAREIHDEFGQVLTVLKMELSWLLKRFPGKQQALREKIQSMSKLVDTAIQTVRKTATELRPGILDDLGLTAAIEWQAQEFEKRTGISCRLNLVPEDLTADPDRSTALFRILQETLTNVARHAKADQIDIRLAREESSLVLQVRDNGIGITEGQATHSKSLGLLGIRERVRLWGGEVTIRGTEESGTEIHVRLPIERRMAPAGDHDQNPYRR